MRTDLQRRQGARAELAGDASVRVVTRADRRSTQAAAQKALGVQAWAGDFAVDPSGRIAPRNAELARTVLDLLARMSSLPQQRIVVWVEEGWVTLSGEVDWPFQREHVAVGVRQIPGVHGVNNQITVSQRPGGRGDHRLCSGPLSPHSGT